MILYFRNLQQSVHAVGFEEGGIEENLTDRCSVDSRADTRVKFTFLCIPIILFAINIQWLTA